MNSPIFGTSAQPAGALPPRPVPVRKAAPRKSVPVFNPNAPKKSTAPQPNQLTPTVEQQLIIDGFQRGENMVISAAAGSGKTSSYIMLAEALHKSNPDGKGVYITFNKSMADEIGEKFFYRNVLASTIHSLANRGIRSNPQYAPLMDKLDGKRELMKPYDRPKVFGVPREVQFGVNPGPVHPKTNPLKVQYTGQTLCAQALLAVEKWCKSADPKIEPKHVIIRKSGKDAIGVPDEVRDRFKEYVADIATRMWDDDIMSVHGKLKFSHDHYLKCQPPGTKVRVVSYEDGTRRRNWVEKNIEDVCVGDRVVSWGGERYGSIKKAGSKVTHIGSREFNGSLVSVTTDSGKVSRYTPDHIAIARMYPGKSRGEHCVYMMRKGSSYRIGRVQWKYGSQGNVHGLNSRMSSQDPDDLWVLSVHDNEVEAALSEAVTAHMYGIPGWQFTSLNEKMPLSKFWEAVGDLTSSATRCLEDHGRNILYPFWSKGNPLPVAQSGAMEIRACNLLDGMLVCDADGAVEYESTQKGYYISSTGGWTRAWTPITVSREKYSGAVHSIEVDKYHTYVADGVVTHNCYQLSGPDIPAQLNLGNRRAALFFDEAQDSRPCITDIVMQQRGKMQIVLCGDSSQAIYRFTGSMDAMRKFKEFKDFKPYLLSKTFRFGPQIAAIANQVLAQIIGSDVRVVPDYSINSTIEVVSGKSPLPTDANGDVPSAVIFRTNQQLIVSIINLLKSGYRVFAHTNVDMIKQVAEDYLALMRWDGNPRNKPKMKNSGMWQFKSIDEIKFTLMKHAQERDAPPLPDDFYLVIPPEEEDTSDVEIEETLIPILTAIADHGPEDIIAAMESMETSERDADVVLSTIHKSKGRQWDSVLMDWTGDAIPKAKTPTDANDELMLFYVGATRAKRKLIIPTEVFVNLTIMNPAYKFADVPHLFPEFSAPDERELIELAYTMHPEYPMEGVRELVTDKAKQHELVHAISEITDTFLHAVPRTDRALLSTAVLSEVGMPAYMEASETAEMGFPQELFAAMLMVRGVTRHVDAVNVILEKEDS